MQDHPQDIALDKPEDAVKDVMLNAPYRDEERFETRVVYFIAFNVKRGNLAFSEEAPRKDCEELIRKVCEDNDWMLEWINVYTDHVRIIIRPWKAEAIDKVVDTIRRGTSQVLITRWKHVWDFSITTLWAVGYFADTQPPEQEVVERYLRRKQARI